jgi:O-Antigen ligase
VRGRPLPWPGIVEALPVAAWFAAVCFVVQREGGFAPNIWYPLALLGLALTVMFAVSATRLLFGASRASLIAVGTLAAFTAWSYATIAWAAVPGDALSGSNKGLLYLLAFGLLACWPLRAQSLWAVLLAGGAVVTLEGLITVEQAIRAADPGDFFIGARLSAPLGYPSASGALFMIVAWLLAGLASRRWVPVPARAVAAGMAGLDGVFSLLTESRGSVFTLPAVAITYFALVPGRLRSLAIVGGIAVTAIPVIPSVLHVYGAADLQPALEHAVNLSLVWAGCVAVAAGIYAAIDARVRLPRRAVRVIGALAVVALAVALAATLAAWRPWTRVDSAWNSFRHAGEPTGAASHFGGLGSNRYDFWRVGFIEFKRHPIAGIGTDNFLVPYLQLRRSSEAPAYPHSLGIKLLSQEGIVGTVLFGAFLVAALVAVLRIPAGENRELAGILLAAAGVWFWHGMVDWLWEMPVLSLLGLGLIGAACGLTQRRSPAPRRSPVARRAVFAVAGVAAAASAVALTLPWIADRQVRQAAKVWPQDPGAAFSELSSASKLNPLSTEADVVAGAIASRLHRYDLMRRRFARAAQRTPDDWYASFELGVAASLTGHHAQAAAALERANRLFPGNEIVEQTLRRFRSGRRIDSDAIDRAFAGGA